MNWIIGTIVIVIVGFLLDREIYFYEGVHLGPRFQSWFYDRWATRYDAGKRESQLHDDEMLAQPLLEELKDVPEPFVLDFATGTGRLSVALLSRPDFNGRINAVDISQEMLKQAASKLTDKLDQVEFVRHRTMPLPFPDAAFDVVCCLEVLELLPDAQAALNEMSRLLRPGGVLLTSRGTEESGRKAKVKSAAEFTSMLQKGGFGNIQITKWWKLFDRVIAIKEGISQPVGPRSLVDVLRCPACSRIGWTKTGQSWQCTNCGKHIATARGIVLN
jgi:2-polyprenyl-3-methyl-5-hydroxy-6-metoxy-1,4-benzoquinol methylase